MLWLFPLFNKCYKCTQHRVWYLMASKRAHKMYVSFDCYAYAWYFFDSHLRYVNYKCLHFQSKNTDHFSETSCQILPPNSRGKRPKWVKWRHQFQVLRVNHFHQVSWLILRAYLPCKPSVWEKIEILTSMSFAIFNKLAWCFCFKLNYVQRVLTYEKAST